MTRLGPKIHVNSVNHRFGRKIQAGLIWEKLRSEFRRAQVNVDEKELIFEYDRLMTVRQMFDLMLENDCIDANENLLTETLSCYLARFQDMGYSMEGTAYLKLASILK